MVMTLLIYYDYTLRLIKFPSGFLFTEKMLSKGQRTEMHFRKINESGLFAI